MKKLLVSLLVLVLVTGCGSKGKIIERDVNSSINNFKTLDENTDLFIKIKVLDGLTLENSSHEEANGEVTEFHSKRKISVEDDFGAGTVIDYIIVSESKVGDDIYRYSNSRSLKKDGEYLVYLTKSDDLDGYEVPQFEGAIIDLQEPFKASTPDVTLSDFISLLNASGKDSTIYHQAKHLSGIKEVSNVENYNVTVGKQSIDYSVAPYGEDKSILEIDSLQYEFENN